MDLSKLEKQQNPTPKSEDEYNPYLLTRKASMLSPYEVKEEKVEKQKPKTDIKKVPKKILKTTFENLKGIFGF